MLNQPPRIPNSLTLHAISDLKPNPNNLGRTDVMDQAIKLVKIVNYTRATIKIKWQNFDL